MKFILKIVAIIVIPLLVVFALQYLDVVSYKYFAPKKENVRREVFENTQSYIEGKRQEITKYYDEWRKADIAEKQALRTIVLQSFSNFNIEYLSYQQQDWYNEIINN